MNGLRDALAAGPLLCDGAMGSLIYERGVFVTSCFEALNLSKADLIHKIQMPNSSSSSQIPIPIKIRRSTAG